MQDLALRSNGHPSYIRVQVQKYPSGTIEAAISSAMFLSPSAGPPSIHLNDSPRRYAPHNVTITPTSLHPSHSRSSSDRPPFPQERHACSHPNLRAMGKSPGGGPQMSIRDRMTSWAQRPADRNCCCECTAYRVIRDGEDQEEERGCTYCEICVFDAGVGEGGIKRRPNLPSDDSSSPLA